MNEIPKEHFVTIVFIFCFMKQHALKGKNIELIFMHYAYKEYYEEYFINTIAKNSKIVNVLCTT